MIYQYPVQNPAKKSKHKRKLLSGFGHSYPYTPLGWTRIYTIEQEYIQLFDESHLLHSGEVSVSNLGCN